MPGKFLLCCLLTALAAPTVWAQSSLAGHVLLQERRDRIPAVGAWVVAYVDDSIVASVAVGEDGAYQLDGIPNGAVEFDVSLSGYYVVEVNGEETLSLHRECPARGSCGEAEFVVMVGGVVEGYVSDFYGDPIPGVVITLADPEQVEDPMGPAQFGIWTNSDDRGRYRFFGLIPGEYAAHFDYSDTLDDQRLFGSERRKVHVEAGVPTSLSVMLNPERGYGPQRDLRGPDQGSLQGRIVARGDHMPIAGAATAIPSTAFQWGNRDGTFRHPLVPAAEQTLLTFKPGFAPSSQNVEVRPGDSVNADVELSLLSTIFGSVSDKEGKSLPESQVVLWGLDRSTGLPRLGNIVSSTVNDLGEYRLFGLLPGKYVVTLRSPSSPQPSGRVELTGPLSVFPAPAFEGNTLNIDQSGTRTVVDFEELKKVETRVGGSIGGSNFCSGPCKVGFYRFSGNLHLPVYEMTAARDGSFSIVGLPQGSYVVAAWGQDGEQRFSGFNTASAVEGRSDRVSVTIRPNRDVYGKLQLISPPANVFDESGRWIRAPAITAEYVGIAGLRTPQLIARVAQPAGYEARFVLQGLAPGDNSFSVGDLPEGAYVRSVQVDTRYMRNGLLEIRQEGPAPELRVEIAFDSGSLSGIAETNGRATWAHIVPLAPPIGSSIHTVAIDRSGRFEAASLAPGRYVVVAAGEEFDHGNLYDQRERTRWARFLREVEVVPGRTTNVALERLRTQ